jgi:hypothetical protein
MKNPSAAISVRFGKLIVLGAVMLGGISSCGKMGKTDDAAITTEIKAKMFSEPSLKAANVDVASRGGEVTLTGQVPDDSARLAAYKIATETKGVTKVNDQMTVLAAQAAPSAAPADSTGCTCRRHKTLGAGGPRKSSVAQNCETKAIGRS